MIFAPENSNFQQAQAMSQRVIQQLKRKGFAWYYIVEPTLTNLQWMKSIILERKGQLDVFQKEVDKKIQIGTLVEVSV